MPKKNRPISERTREMRELLQSVAPGCSHEVIAQISIDLLDLAEVGVKHKQDVEGLLALNERQRQSKLQQLLANVDVNVLFEADFHIKSLKKNWPKLVKHLE